jgi:hypothetical protein
MPPERAVPELQFTAVCQKVNSRIELCRIGRARRRPDLYLAGLPASHRRRKVGTAAQITASASKTKTGINGLLGSISSKSSTRPAMAFARKHKKRFMPEVYENRITASATYRSFFNWLLKNSHTTHLQN